MKKRVNLQRGAYSLVICLAVVLSAGAVSAQTGFDKLLADLQRPASGYVADYAGVLSEMDKASLNNSLRAINDATSAPIRIVIVTLPSLKGGQIDDFSVKLFEKWGIGERGKDNGVLVLAAMEERSVRIETGYGAEGILNAARCGNIRDTIIVPNFREQRYAAGFDGAIQALMAAAGGMPGTRVSGRVAARTAAATGAEQAGGIGQFLPILVFVVIVAVIIVLARKSKSSGSGRGGGMSGGCMPGGSSGGGVSSGGGGGAFGGGRSGGGGASGKW